MAAKNQVHRKKTAREVAEKTGFCERTIRNWFAIPRAEYEANSISRAKPWEVMGISRATWYRHGKPTPKTDTADAV
jgi:transcription initiation factor TFIIIB Brf1 subunit/transcription initiation factor TFIIB